MLEGDESMYERRVGQTQPNTRELAARFHRRFDEPRAQDRVVYDPEDFAAILAPTTKPTGPVRENLDSAQIDGKTSRQTPSGRSSARRNR